MRKALLVLTIGLLLGSFVPLSAQGSLSSQVLRLLERNNTWTGIQTFDSTVGLVLSTDGLTPTAGTVNTLYNLNGVLYWNGSAVTTAASTGTVTSVDLTMPSIFSVSGNPITGAGTLAVDLDDQAANKVFAGPTTGANAAPTFRALVAADIPDISATYATASSTTTFTNKSGNISQWTNNSGYLTTSATTLSSLTTVGTLTSGTWNATVIAGLYGGTGVANSGKTITLGGNITTAAAFITSGANSLTLTTTGSTNVTLPTSGTLLTSTATSLASLTTVGTIGTGVWQGTAVGVAYGGTGLSSYTQGDLLYASAGTTISKLAKSASADRLLCNTGSSNNPAWCQADLTKAVTGILPSANGGVGINASSPTDGQLLIGKTSDGSWNKATITGTANQITVTLGAGSITLATPQAIATASTPQFARLGLGTGAGAAALITGAGQLDLGFVNDGSCGASDTIDWNGGEIHKSTLSAATCTYTFSNPIAGRTYVLHVIQDGTGGRLVTWPGTVTWKGGSAPTLTATAAKTDVCYFRWNGSAYLSDCDLNY